MGTIKILGEQVAIESMVKCLNYDITQKNRLTMVDLETLSLRAEKLRQVIIDEFRKETTCSFGNVATMWEKYALKNKNFRAEFIRCVNLLNSLDEVEDKLRELEREYIC